MAEYVLENETIKVVIDSHGAELKSLVKKAKGTEYMWCGDAAFWGRTSPVLFPVVGQYKDKQFEAKGKTYTMGQHGFARDMKFTLESQTEDKIWFCLASSEETLEKYPYEFKLHVGYKLKKKGVDFLWKVENTGKEYLPFSIGGHPAFNCPIHEKEKQTDCYLYFEKADGTPAKKVVSTRLEQGLAGKETDTYKLKEGFYQIADDLFDKDALVIESQGITKVSLCDGKKKPYLTVKMDAPLFGVWSPVSKHAPFVCIEPWYGRCDGVDFEGSLFDRTWGNALIPGAVFETKYGVRV